MKNHVLCTIISAVWYKCSSITHGHTEFTLWRV